MRNKFLKKLYFFRYQMLLRYFIWTLSAYMISRYHKHSKQRWKAEKEVSQYSWVTKDYKLVIFVTGGPKSSYWNADFAGDFEDYVKIKCAVFFTDRDDVCNPLFYEHAERWIIHLQYILISKAIATDVIKGFYIVNSNVTTLLLKHTALKLLRMYKFIVE